MTEKPKKKATKHKKWPWLTAAIVFILLLLAGAGLIFLKINYQTKIYPGVKVGKINLGGQTLDQAIATLKPFDEEIDKVGFNFIWQNNRLNLSTVISPTLNPDSALTIYEGNPEQTAKNALQLGHSQNFWSDLITAWRLLTFGQTVDFVYQLDENNFLPYLKDLLAKYETPGQDAGLLIKLKPENQQWEISLTPAKIGQTFNDHLIIKQLKNNLNQLDNQAINLELLTDLPKINENQAQPLIAAAQNLLNNTSTLAFTYQEDKWEITKPQLASWLTLEKNNDQVNLAVAPTEAKKFLASLAETIDVLPQEPKLTLENGKAKDFFAPQDGLKVDLEKNLALLNNNFLATSTLPLIVEKTPAKVALGDVNDIGIKEIIGTGHSNFKGSPTNRRKNIRTGANALNGILIKPGEEFSLVTALGTIDNTTGYLPELVIKENRTVPEFGGGLCQIATTVFRSALYSGLPITARTNHSYRVTYYEPAGMDATIYQPRPDLKFINDTKNYILIQSRIKGDDIYFDFWGNKDGRLVEISKPKIYNLTAPPAAKLIETTSLAPGEKKCTESAHAGADAEFDYLVTYADGQTKTVNFFSRYRPWGSVCLIGVKQISTATTTTETIPLVP
ncbi:MAG: VanW family protein [Candidatus Buchananbacteria bacterium]